MWQRVQTLYLAIATILIGSLFFSKVMTIIGTDGEESVVMYYEKTVYLMFTVMVFTANIAALVLFKARLLQMRITMIGVLLLIAYQIWLGVDFFTNLKNDEMVFSVTVIFPLIAVILDLMAVRNIALDEAMVQSASRLRGVRKLKL